jgi:signal transduction histidine kinase
LEGVEKSEKRRNASGDKLRRAGKTLHDDVGPLLAAAGLRLQLLRMDHPQASEQVNELLVTLDDAMERIRALSRELSPPARSAPESATKKATIV